MRVANIQLILNTMGYSVRTDGYFDVVTKDAILDIQNENGLTETGNIDSDTLVVINNALGDYLNDDANDSMLQASIDYFSE
jgi:carboxyl-terminal processing protease